MFLQGLGIPARDPFDVLPGLGIPARDPFDVLQGLGIPEDIHTELLIPI